ncbi:MAG: cell envelope-related transcriptional attenuator [uncultured bacterium]|nr:MAG: cell envelope-related transcriptional attenuator [uncultured bacterium]
MRFIKFVLLFFVALLVLSVSLASSYYFLVPKLQQNVAVLILGKGGEGHTAPDLTDTIMLANLNISSQKASILSIPRDIWISEIRAKLNTAYHYGGFKMVGDSVTSITGLPISYTVVVDFSLFKDLIDSIGGINVEVENFFVDEKYPIAGLENDLCNGDRLYKCRYETLTFNSGRQSMSGELALKFVRSRNAEDDEGTDIAREKRQQKVIEAVREKLLSKEVLLKPSVLRKLYDVTISHIETDIDKNNMVLIIKFLFESRNNIKFLSIPEDMLIISQNNKKYDKQYVFIPKSGSWKELQEWIKKEI